MKKEKSFRNWREGSIHLNFPNGNHISTTWARIYTYSDNYNLDVDYSKPRPIGDRIDPIVESDTVEIMVSCGDKLKKKILKKYNEGHEQPIGYLPITQWVEIINLLAKE